MGSIDNNLEGVRLEFGNYPTLRTFCPINQNIVDSEKHAQNGMFLIAKWHLTDTAVHESIF